MATLQARLGDLITAIGTDYKVIVGRIGTLASLTTTAKTDLVSAINEVNAKPSGTGGAVINDTTPSGTTTYSSNKSDSLLSAKAPLASPTFTGTVGGITKAMVGLPNVDNTADTAKPVSTAQQAALDLKAPLASPTFTGVVAGVTKTHVGLANVDNTADTAKPVSTAQQAALDLKAPLASPTFTGVVSGVTKAHVGLGNVDNTADTAKPVSTAQQTAINALIADASLTNATATTYSANKINSAISTAISNLVNGASTTLDTLNEIAAALGNDANFATTMTNALGVRLRFDAAQTLTAAQKIQGKANLDAYGNVEIGNYDADLVALYTTAKV
jgi:hypothetical protein